MGKSKIDPIIQRKLYNLATPLDKGALWSALESELVQPEEDNRKGLVIWLFGGLLFAALCLYGYGLYNQSSPYISQITTNAVDPIPQKEHVVAFNAVDEEEVVESKGEGELLQASSSVKEEKAIDKREKINDTSNTKSTPREKVIEKNTKAQELTTSTSAINLVMQDQMLPIAATQDIQPLEPSASSNKESHQSKMVLLSDIGQTPVSLLYDDVEPMELNLTPTKIKRVDCYDYNYTYSPISILAYYGPGVSKRWLSNEQPGTEADSHFSLRDTNESTLEGHRAGALLKFKLKSGFFVKAGIEVANINEKLEYESSVEESVLIMNTIIRYEEDENGVITPIYGDIQGVIVTNKKWLFYNQYRFIDIPVLVGYEFRTNRWNIALEGGVLINQSMKFTDGKSSDYGSTFGLVSGEPELSEDFYKARTGLALQLGGGIGYSINKNITFWATPSFRHGLGSLGSNNYVLDQNYTSANLLVGAELKF